MGIIISLLLSNPLKSMRYFCKLVIISDLEWVQVTSYLLCYFVSLMYWKWAHTSRSSNSMVVWRVTDIQKKSSFLFRIRCPTVTRKFRYTLYKMCKVPCRWDLDADAVQERSVGYCCCCCGDISRWLTDDGTKYTRSSGVKSRCNAATYTQQSTRAVFVRFSLGGVRVSTGD